MKLYYDDQDHYQNWEGKVSAEKEDCKQLDTNDVEVYKTDITSRYVSLVGDYTRWKILAVMKDGTVNTLVYFEMDPYRNGTSLNHDDILETGIDMITEAISSGVDEFVLDFSEILKRLDQVGSWSHWMNMIGTDDNDDYEFSDLNFKEKIYAISFIAGIVMGVVFVLCLFSNFIRGL